MPWAAVRSETNPMPPARSTLTAQLHWPFVSLQTEVVQPKTLNRFDVFSQATGTDETVRHEAASGKVAEPVVRVLSAKVPSALATKLPVVVTEPVTGTVGHARLNRDTSMLPDNLRHDDVTDHDPTTLPPQADTLLQLPPPLEVPAALLPPPDVAAPPLELPADAEPFPPPDPLLHAAAARENSASAPKNTRCAFRMVSFRVSESCERVQGEPTILSSTTLWLGTLAAV